VWNTMSDAKSIKARSLLLQILSNWIHEHRKNFISWQILAVPGEMFSRLKEQCVI
jgi:hypothetical protein